MALTVSEEAAIKGVLNRAFEVWNTRDAKGCADFYTADGDLLAADGTFLRSPAEVERYYVTQLTGAGAYRNFRGTNFNVVSLHAIQPGFAILDATWDVTTSGGGAGAQSEIVARPMGTWILKKEAEEWKFLAVRVMIPFGLKQPQAT